MTERHRLALIGGRGYTGMSFLPLVREHPQMALALASSSSQAGLPITEIDPDWPEAGDTLVALAPDGVRAVDADIWVMALPNDQSKPWVAAIEAAHPEAVIIDFSADHRFDNDWVYGLTELHRSDLVGARRIANPGCYATAAGLALVPLADDLDAPPVVFGVSGHSGAGKTPSPRNDPERLANNLMPYQLTGHVHEQEISHRLGRDVAFHPHVAPFFRGLSVTIRAQFKAPVEAQTLLDRWRQVYADAPLIEVVADVPEIRQVAGSARAMLGGVSVDARDARSVSFVVVLDNLLKGAASQAMQNINVSLGLGALSGLDRVATPGG
mgnify:CR=1 FL=1